MEASSTTLNISGPVVEPVEAKPAVALLNGHNHKANFGRYVADCEGCQLKYPDGPPAARAHVNQRRAPNVLAQEKSDEVEELKRKLAKAGADLARAQAAPIVVQAPASSGDPQLEALVKLMLGKEQRGLQKEADDLVRREESRQQMLTVERERIRQKEAREMACEANGHRKENGRTAINGQVHNDGLYHPICFHCFKTFPPVRPNQEAIQNGVQLV